MPFECTLANPAKQRLCAAASSGVTRLTNVGIVVQEDLMNLMGDHHSDPNIDLHFCGMSGQLLELPPELVLL